MTIPFNVRVKFYLLRGLAFAIALLGVVVYAFSHSDDVRLAAIPSVFVALGLVKTSNRMVLKARGMLWAEKVDVSVRRVGPLVWMGAVVSLLACVGFYFAMDVDAALGGKQVWLLYAFVGATLALGFAVTYIVMKLAR